jgi:hypothetical protein
MILLSSCVYTILLDHVHSIKLSDNEEVVHPGCHNAEDVNFRFGGCVISSMLKARYKAIRTCSQNRKDEISQAIEILHAINTKSKSEMPEYIKYRDRGFMYSLDPCLIPFICEVDKSTCVVTNEESFQQYGDDLVKVNINSVTLFIISSFNV